MRILIISIILVSSFASAQMDTIYVNEKIGVSEGYQIYNSQEITFKSVTNDDFMYIEQRDGNIISYKLSEIERIVFNGMTGYIEELENLFQIKNYPNPFNESTNYTYVLETKSFVELNIYNIRGDYIRNLVHQEQVPSTYTISWDGRDINGNRLSSGYYFFQLKYDNKIIFLQTILIN